MLESWDLGFGDGVPTLGLVSGDIEEGEGKYIWNSRIERSLSAPDILSFRRSWVSRRAHF